MTKRKREKKIIEPNEVEPFEAEVRQTESAPAESEAPVPETDQPGASEQGVAEELVQNEEAGAVEDLSPDDLLEDVRHSLIEEESSREEQKKPRWWNPFGKGGRKGKVEEEQPAVVETEPEASSPAVEDVPVETPDEYAEQIDDLIDMLEAEKEEPPAPAPVPVPETKVQEEKVALDIEEMKKQAFRARTPEDREESFSEVRTIALDGGEEVFVEVESKKEDPLEERFKAFENSLRPYRRYIYFGITFVGIVALVVTSVLLYTAYRQSLPPEPLTDEEAALLPYPTMVSLPGGLDFQLGKGVLDRGRWNPRGPEWLQGTEVCRWVAIPWSVQLEAVVRTLTRDDTIELVMSNSDRIEYNVYSIEQLSLEEMQNRDSNSPCLLLVLAEADSDKRWVVTALP
ncbi:MAG: hypothetical protein C3F07_05150 [Anaerolineales bacterium]|nr:hypothetical protein [Anaerolineae bacterium]PWB75722.1 MAG: hypothetical protein C3F07_05150 [Anaerolineales bacterium]